jgi:hypothetical protein
VTNTKPTIVSDDGEIQLVVTLPATNPKYPQDYLDRLVGKIRRRGKGNKKSGVGSGARFFFTHRPPRHLQRQVLNAQLKNIVEIYLMLLKHMK